MRKLWSPALLLGVAGLALFVAAGAVGMVSSPASAGAGGRDPDALALVELGRGAARRASELTPNAVLRQVDVLSGTGRTIFYFTDNPPVREINIEAAMSIGPDACQVRTTTHSKLVLFPGTPVHLEELRIGAQRVTHGLTRHWPGCVVTSVTLYPSGGDLTWTGFCRLPDGRIASGSAANHSGAFAPSLAPPAYPAPTALPN